MSVESAWELRQGDCLALLPEVEAGSVALAFVDSPYNQGVNYGSGRKADLLSDRDFVRWCRRWIEECYRVLSSTGTLWILISNEYVCELGCEAKTAGFAKRSHIIWYESFGVCNNALTNFSRSHRHLMRFTKSNEWTFNPDTLMVPSDRQAKYGDKRANPSGKIMNDVWLDVPRVCGTFKERVKGVPTQLPIALVQRCIACTSNPGDLVLDPFAGSGTSGVAALSLSRRWLGMELNSTFAEIARSRLIAVSEGKE